jgi:hypothetical protein
MNERIKELAEQAGFNTSPNTDVITNNHFGGYMDGRQFEKFAELIVRECMEQIHIQSRGPCGDYHGQWFESDILKHFGVEE